MSDESRSSYEGHREGRAALEAWREAQPDNAYEADRHFQRLVDLYGDPDKHADLDETLRAFDADVAGPI
ncbi:MAG: hypothetical protein ABEL76_00980, partial [Bradymonadaceae bacterium]